MSIASQISRLLQAKADIKSAIENKGGTVSSSAKLNDYAGLINNLAFPIVQPLSVTSNGTYSASSGYAYSPVTVSVAGGGGSTTHTATLTNSGSLLAYVKYNNVEYYTTGQTFEYEAGDTVELVSYPNGTRFAVL